jgi:outer membrane receptor protein involved in Fe transport
MDHQWRSESITGTFSFGNVDSIHPDPFPGKAGGGSFSGNIHNKSYVVGISDVHSFSSTKINEFKIGYTRYPVNAVPFFSNEALATEMGIPGINVPGDKNTNGLPNIMISGYSSLGNQDWFPEILKENNYQLKDSFSWTHGRHSFKAGGDVIRRQHGFFQTQNPRGDFSFDQQFTENINDTANDPGSALASFLIGNPIYSFRDGLAGSFGMSWWETSLYFMDDFRVSPKLTLNLGLRYDVFTPMVEEHNRIANFDFATGTFVAPGINGVSDTANVRTNHKNFAPRIGFATHHSMTPEPFCAAATAFSIACKPTRTTPNWPTIPPAYSATRPFSSTLIPGPRCNCQRDSLPRRIRPVPCRLRI